LVAPNWSVKPTAARAKIDAVTSPKPIEETKMLIEPYYRTRRSLRLPSFLAA